MAKFDDVIEAVGGFDRFQFRMLALFLISVIPTGYNVLFSLFALTVPPHRCALDNYSNDTFEVQGPHHGLLINKSIPREESGGQVALSSCYVYRASNQSVDSSTISNLTEKVECNRWVFDREYFGRTVIEELSLVCEKKVYRTHANMAMMLGNLFSASTQGFLSDTIGRRYTMFLFAALTALSGLVNAFSFNVPSLLAFRFLSGFSSCLFLNGYVLNVEFIGVGRRQLFNQISTLFWIIASFLVTLIAYFIRDFQNLSLSMAAQMVFLLALYFVPESPRWLASKRRFEESKAVLKKMATVNKREFPEAMFQEVTREYEREYLMTTEGKDPTSEDVKQEVKESMAINPDSSATEIKLSEKDEKENITSLFRYKLTAARFVIVLWNWFASGLIYYGVLLNMQNLSGSIYVNFSLLNIVSLVANPPTYFFIERFGRKKSYIACYVVCILASLATIFPVVSNEDSGMAILVLTLLGYVSMGVAFSVAYLFTAEIFPTSTRNSVMGVSSMAARMGSAVAPYLADLGVLVGGPMKDALPFLAFGAVAVLTTVTAFFLPETMGQALPNNVHEALEIGRPRLQKKHHSSSLPINDDDVKTEKSKQLLSEQEKPAWV